MRAGGLHLVNFNLFFFSSRRRHTRFDCDWSSDVCSSDLAFDDDEEGIEIWGKSAKDDKIYKLCLYGKDIDGYYENMVTLRPNLPQDDAQRMAFGLQMVNSGNLSKQTFWDKWVSVDMPNDEQDRIWAEKLLESPELAQNIQLVKLIEVRPKSWEMIIKGTPLEQVAERMFGPKEPPPPAMA